MPLILRNKEFRFDRTLIMGIINVTPDSFSDGGLFKNSDKAVKKAIDLVKDGADIIDIGGESARPGALPVEKEEELNRVIPVIKKFREIDNETPISIDTYKSDIAEQAILNGADIINDISGGTFDENIIRIAAKHKSVYILMHMQGKPLNMQQNPVYSEKGVIFDIKEFFYNRIKMLEYMGIQKDKIVLDPGIGFGKTLNDNIEILNNLSEFKLFDLPVLVGTSRKTFIGNILNKPPGDRLYGTIASVVLAIINGASIIRVHDVKEVKDAVNVIDKILQNKRFVRIN
ncbi:MAG: dihydropteroate synthase [Candidatus Goldbacteria bacterium]|nr:dihydropteroate synthase [Candidatus Goldiibacteriota bacterium]